MRFSVVVISWNQHAFLERLVGQLLTQGYPADLYEIIVVDDGSTDGSREWLNQVTDSRVRAIFGTENRGRGASRNAGIRAATGEVVVMIDGDHTIPGDYLSILAERHARERCIVVGKSHFADHPEHRALNAYLNHGGASKLRRDTPLPGRYFLTRSCSVPRDVLLKAGMFDESFVAWGGEDLDLGMKLEATGVPIYGEDRCLAIHHHHRALDELLNVMYVYGRDSIPVLLERHPQLFRGLNLHRTLAEDGNPHRLTAGRALFRLLMLAPIYHSIRILAKRGRRFRLPRAIFDYLHLRQYTYGFREHLRTKKA